MNLVLALEQLGYTNGTDFEVRWNGAAHTIAVWNHADPQPDQPSLDAAWDAWVAANTPTAQENLDTAKAQAKLAIDEKAGIVRKRFISSGVGMELTYEQKRHEAEAFKTAGYPEGQIADYPFIEAEAIATDDTGQQAADDILAVYAAWKVAGSEVEKQRRIGKIQVDQQLSVAGVEAARDNAIAALDAITP